MKDKLTTNVYLDQVAPPDTNQKVHESGHERDSSGDRFECTKCGFVKHGLTGEWEHYV